MEAISYWTFTTKRSLSQKYPSEKRLLLKKGPIGTCTAHLLFFDFKLHFDLIYGKAKGQIVMQRFSIMNVFMLNTVMKLWMKTGKKMFFLNVGFLL